LNGTPVWEKSMTGSKIIYVPLISKNKVQSFIAAFPQPGDKFIFRLYNIDSLNALKFNKRLLTAYSVLAQFEKSIFNRESIKTNRFEMKNANVVFKDFKMPHRSAAREACVTVTTISYSYVWRDFSYSYDGQTGYWETTSVKVEHQYGDCMTYGSGGGDWNFGWINIGYGGGGSPIPGTGDGYTPGGGGGGSYDNYRPPYNANYSDAIVEEINYILRNGDSFEIDRYIDRESPRFDDVPKFDSWLKEQETNFLNSPEKFEALNESTVIGDVVLGPGFGIHVFAKIEKGTDGKYTVKEISSEDYGITIHWSWKEKTTTQVTTGNIITVKVEGYINYYVFIEGLGTVYKSYRRIEMGIDKTTGKVVSLKKFK
jgi:hypothetical protein